MDRDLGSLPRDTFVQKLIEMCKTSNRDVETIRHELFDVVKRQPNFPFPNAILKKSLCQRKANGDSIENKLGNDCYALYLASTGEFGDDLKNALSVKAANASSNRAISCADEFSWSQSDQTQMKDTLIRQEHDLISLKSDYVRDTSVLNKSIDKLKKENKVLRECNSKCSDRLLNLQNQLNLIRTKVDTTTDCNKRTETELTSLRKKVKENSEQISKATTQLSSMCLQFSDTSELASATKTEIVKIRDNMMKLTSDFKTIDKAIKEESNRINRMSYTQAIGVSSLNSKTDIINSKIKDLDESVERISDTYNSLCTAVSDIRKRLANTEKDLKFANKNYKTYSDIVRTSKEANGDTNNSLKNNACGENSNGPSHQNISHSDVQTVTKPLATETKHPLDETPKEIHHKNITVHCPSSVCNPSSNLDFSGFKHNERRRIARFYVGGINKTISSEQGMRSFLHEHGIRVTFLRYFDKRIRKQPQPN